MIQGFARSGFILKHFLEKYIVNVELVHVQWLMDRLMISICAWSSGKFLYLSSKSIHISNFLKTSFNSSGEFISFHFPRIQNISLERPTANGEKITLFWHYSAVQNFHWNPNWRWQNSDSIKIHENKGNFGNSKYKLEVNKMNWNW